MKRSLAVIVAIAALLPVVGAAQPAAADTTTPIIFLHGFVLGAPCPGINARGQALGLIAELAERGYTGPVVGAEYFACDSQGETIQQSGVRGAYFESGEWTNNQSWGEYRGNTNSTDLRHIAYQLAWWTYDNYSSKGKHVSFVGYSMGGLIARWALYQIAARNPLFPPYLYVDKAATISTPHRGLTPDLQYPVWCGTSIQCTQMKAKSTFLNELNSGLGLNPQGTGGTTWTVLGSARCDIMTPDQSTNMGPVHKVIFNGAKPYCYSHTSYLQDRSDLRDFPVLVQRPTDPKPVAGLGLHSLATVAEALR